MAACAHFCQSQPQPGEPALYNSGSTGYAASGSTEYGVLAFLANPSGNGNVLILEGTSVAGTESVSDYLFANDRLEPFLARIRRADGSLPHFEMLLASENVNGSASPSRLVAWHVHPN